MNRFSAVAMSSLAMMLSTGAHAAIVTTVTEFSDSAFISIGDATNSDSRNTIAALPTASTAHNYQVYSPVSSYSSVEARMFATAATSPNSTLAFQYGQDGSAGYSLDSLQNTSGALMKVGETFHIKINLTNTSTDWQDLTLKSWNGMRYNMYTYGNIGAEIGAPSLGTPMSGNEYMSLWTDFSLLVDGVEVWERVLNKRMDASGDFPHQFLSNQNPPPDLITDILLGAWGPNETRVLELNFTGLMETNVDASSRAFMSMAAFFVPQGLTTSLGQPRQTDPSHGTGGGNAIPEPSPIALMGLALAGMALARKSSSSKGAGKLHPSSGI